MAGLARVVIPGMGHHITQRGNRRQQTFFDDEDRAAYVELMADGRGEEGVAIWGYCLMPNHRTERSDYESRRRVSLNAASSEGNAAERSLWDLRKPLTKSSATAWKSGSPSLVL